MNKLFKIYNLLFNMYGPQGWWPLLCCKRKNAKTSKSESLRGYHPGDYSYPENEMQRFEICIGAILTQNTAWINVEKALINLANNILFDASNIKEIKIENLKELIKPAGYYNQKANYIKEFADFFSSLDSETPSRKELLKIKGIGQETADSILLYAYNNLEFVVDVYTKRIFSDLGFFNSSAKYEEIKEIFKKNIPSDIIIYQEYHALIVMHAKRYYSKKNNSILKPFIY